MGNCKQTQMYLVTKVEMQTSFVKKNHTKMTNSSSIFVFQHTCYWNLSFLYDFSRLNLHIKFCNEVHVWTNYACGYFQKKMEISKYTFQRDFHNSKKKKWFALNIFTAKEDQIARNLLTLVVGGSTKFSLPSTMQSMGEGNGLRPGSLLRSSWGGRAFAFYYLYIYIVCNCAESFTFK